MARMQVAGQKKVDPAARENLHGDRRTAHQISIAKAGGQIKGMVRHDYSGDAIIQRAEPLSNMLHLYRVDPPILDGERAGRVYAKYRDFFVDMKRREVIRDVAPVLFKRAKKAVNNVM